MVVDTSECVLIGVAAHTHAQNETTPGEVLERRGLLGHCGRVAQGKLQDAGEPNVGRRVAAAPMARVVRHSLMG